MSKDSLVCPGCSRPQPAEERFCPSCGLPLVFPPGTEPEGTERQRRARKILPEYAEGELVKIARALNQSEAEFIAGLLLEEGIPSLVRRATSFDVAESLAAGPRDVLVPESGAQAAREALTWNGPAADSAPS